MNTSTSSESQLHSILEILCKPYDKYMLDKAILILYNTNIEDIKSNPTLYNALSQALADRIYELFTNGALCEIEYICIFKILHRSGFTKDTRFVPFVENIKPLMFSHDVSEIENILFLQVCSVAMMFAYGADEGIKFFITHFCLLDMNVPQSEKVADFIIKFFPEVKFELCLEALSQCVADSIHLTSKRRRSVFNWQLHCLWNVEGYFNNTKWLTLYPVWKEVFYTLLDSISTAIKRGAIQDGLEKLDEALYLQFFIYHMCGNSFHTQEQWQEFCEAIDKKATAVYVLLSPYMCEIAPDIESTKEHNSRERHIIGVLKDRIVSNSPYKVEYSLFKNLLNNQDFASKFCIKIYNMALIEKSEDDKNLYQELENLGIEICDVVKIENTKGFYNSHLHKALLLWSALKKDGVQCLLSPNNGYGISDFLLSVGVAREQIYYSHGNFVYDIPALSQRITHICNAQKSITHYGFAFIGVPVTMDKRFYNPPVPNHLVQALRTQYPCDVKILGTIGRLIKLDSKEYLQSVIRIMQSYPKSIYLACGGGNEQAIRTKIIQECGDEALLERFYFTGYIDSALYGHIIDIWLDSFPLEQGESRIEYVAKGGVALVYSYESKIHRTSRISHWVAQHKNILQEFLEHYNKQTHIVALQSMQDIQTLLIESQCVTFSISEYEQRAVHFLQSKDLSLIRAKSLLEREILDFVRERLGVESFMEILDSVYTI